MLAKWYNNPLFYHMHKFNHEGSQDSEYFVRPSSNVNEKDDSFQIEMAVPGFSKKEIKISMDKDILTISSEKDFGKSDDNGYLRREFGGHNFKRSFSIPESVDVDNISAEYKNGILTLTLPKKEEVKIKKEIQIA
jgi:HSP20 family protein